MYIIIKHVKKSDGIRLPVIVLGNENEILEFTSEEKANSMCEIFNTNTDSGHVYVVKKIG